MKSYRQVIEQIIKYAAVGALASAFELSCLYVLTSRLHLWYLYGSIIVSCLSFTMSFLLRKFWVFKAKGRDTIFRQISFYLLTLLGILMLNTLIISLLVEKVHVPYLAGQFLASLFSGSLGFIINRTVTFKKAGFFQHG